MKVYVTGFGMITSIGKDAEECLVNLKAGKTGIQKDPVSGLMLGNVKFTDDDLKKKLGLLDENFSRTSLLGCVAAKEAWGENRMHPNIRTGLISGTTVGGIDRTEEYFFEVLSGKSEDALSMMTYDNGQESENIARFIGISGYIDTIATACSSGANAILHGAELIRHDKLDRVLVGSSDPFSQYTIKGFSSLGIFDSEICKPFDQGRNGLNLGEGSAFLLLESERSMEWSGNRPYCILSGWNNSSDAYHQTASSPDGKGAALAMRKAMEKAEITKQQIDYINVHGTGTPNNDLSESYALKNVFGNEIPPFSSTKGFTGHTLAAAGSVEAIFCIQSILHQFYPPNLNFKNKMEETGFIPEISSKKKADINYILSNSFGFGGNCTSLIFSKIN